MALECFKEKLDFFFFIFIELLEVNKLISFHSPVFFFFSGWPYRSSAEGRVAVGSGCC